MANVLMSAQIDRIIRIAGVLEDRWFTDEDIEDFAAYVGAIDEDGNYDATRQGLVAIQLLRTLAIRDRKSASSVQQIRQRIIELERESPKPSPSGSTVVIIGGGGGGGVDLSDYYTMSEVDALIAAVVAGETDLSGYLESDKLERWANTDHPTQQFPESKIPAIVWVSDDDVNINSNTWDGMVTNGVVIGISNTRIRVYRRTANDFAPYLTLIGTVTGSDLSQADFNVLSNVWWNTITGAALRGKADIPSWLVDPLEDIPPRKADGLMKPYARLPNDAVVPVIPDVKIARGDLHTTQQLPAALGTAGQVAKINAAGNGIIWSDDLVGTPGSQGEAIVRVGLAESFTSNPDADHVGDVVFQKRGPLGGLGFMTPGGSVTTSLDGALVLQDLLGFKGIISVTSLPAVGDAEWGVIYALGTTVGGNIETRELHYKQRIEEQIIEIPIFRLPSPDDGVGIISYGWSETQENGDHAAGGSITPPESAQSTIYRLVQVRNRLNAPQIIIINNTDGPLSGHAASFGLEYRLKGTSAWTTINLTPVPGFNVPQQAKWQHSGAENGAFLLTPESIYQFRFPSPTQAGQHITLHTVDAMRQLADEIDISNAVAEAIHTAAQGDALIRASLGPQIRTYATQAAYDAAVASPDFVDFLAIP